MAAAISSAAPSPCTRTGTTNTSVHDAQHFEKIADRRPEGLVTTAIFRANRGSGRLWAGSKRPSPASFWRSCRNASSKAPIPLGWISWTINWYFPCGG